MNNFTFCFAGPVAASAMDSGSLLKVVMGPVEV